MLDYGLKDLRCLDILLRECHVSRAASHMGISQPAMSMALARLRQIFEDPLLVRRGNGLSPTNVAEKLHGRVKIMIREMEELTAYEKEFDPTASNHQFTLILTDYIDAILVPSLHAAFKKEGADIKLKIIGPNPTRMGSLFNEGSVDLTVTYFPDAPQNLIARSLLSDRMICMARRGHPALDKIISLDDFCSLDHVAIEPAEASMYRVMLDDALAVLGKSRHIAISKPDFNGVPSLLQDSDLVATMPERLAVLFQQRFDLCIFDPPVDIPPLNIQMMWHSSTQHSAPHMWLRDKVLEVTSA